MTGEGADPLFVLMMYCTGTLFLAAILVPIARATGWLKKGTSLVPTGRREWFTVAALWVSTSVVYVVTVWGIFKLGSPIFGVVDWGLAPPCTIIIAIFASMLMPSTRNPFRTHQIVGLCLAVLGLFCFLCARIDNDPVAYLKLTDNEENEIAKILPDGVDLTSEFLSREAGQETVNKIERILEDEQKRKKLRTLRERAGVNRQLWLGLALLSPLFTAIGFNLQGHLIRDLGMHPLLVLFWRFPIPALLVFVWFIYSLTRGLPVWPGWEHWLPLLVITPLFFFLPLLLLCND